MSLLTSYSFNFNDAIALWNYSLSVGSLKDDPTICDRCNAALKGEF